MIRIGKISSVDKENGMASVIYEDEDDATTGMIPIMAPFVAMKIDDHPSKTLDHKNSNGDPLDIQDHSLPKLKHSGKIIINFPEVGQYVLVAHLSNGPTDGVIIGTYYNETNPPEV